MRRSPLIRRRPLRAGLGPPARRWLALCTVIVVCLLAARQGWSEAYSVAPPDARADETLTVMTLNLAHGRGTAFHQLLLNRERIHTNLDAVAAVAERESPDVLALQEADARSDWSGRFNHISYLAERTGLQHQFRGRHVHAFGLEYGTALLSRAPLIEAISQRFSPSALTPPKGFVLASVQWPGMPALLVDVVSVHLEFFRDSVQLRQAAELAELLKSRSKPLIVMGDFNVDWDDSDGVLPFLVHTLGLRAYDAEGDGFFTLPRFHRRVDWILVSTDLAFVSYKVLPEPLSDHRAVVASLRLAGQSAAAAPRVSQLN